MTQQNDWTVTQLLEKVDLVSIISKHVTLTKKGGEYVGLCPFHKEKTPSFSVNEEKQLYFCHGCAAGGDAFTFLKDMHGTEDKETYNLLKQECGIIDHDNSQPTSQPHQRQAPERKHDPSDDWEPIFPVPSHAPKLMDKGRTNPIYNPKREADGKDPYVTYTPEPGGVYPYTTTDGKLLGAVLRIFINGKKLTPTVTYCVNTTTGEESWCLKGFPEPKPLYNQDRWQDRDAVLVVEGERCVDAANDRVSSRYDVTTWPNGTNAVEKADFSALYGRNVVLWADHDLQDFKRGPREGERKPVDEQNGRKAMLCIKRHLEANGSVVTLLDQPENQIDGWDCADAVEEERDLLQYIADHMPEPEQPKPEQDQADASEAETEATPEPPDPTDASNIIKPLGYDGSSFFYYSTQTQQLRELKDREHTESRMLGLADVEWWEMKFPKKGGFDSSAAASWMMSSCRLRGIFDPKTIRGRGCWMDDGRFVIHLGDRLIVDGVTKSLNDFRSKYLYQAARRKKAPHNALSDEEAKGLLEVAKAFDWEVEASGALLAGWCVIAPLCGALDWRPHLWVTGGSGSGKSTIFKHYIKPIVGDMAIYTGLNSSEAGLRQELNADALPSIFEEFDPQTKATRDKAQGFFDLMRIASDDNGIKILRGSTGGQSSSFQLNTIFCLIGIQICTTEQAILNRTAKLALRSKPSSRKQEVNEHNAQQWVKMQELITEKLMSIEDLSSRLFARTVGMIDTIQHNIKVFRSAANKHFGMARYADQYGTLLAGAYSLVSDCRVKEDVALRYIASFDWTSYTEESDVNESDQALSSIMQIPLRVEGDGKMATKSIGEWVSMVHRKGAVDPERLAWGDASDALKRCGIKVDQVGGKTVIMVANNSEFLKDALQDKPWGQNWNRYIKRALSSRSIDGNIKKTVYFAPGLNSRAVGVPYNVIESLGGDDE